MDSQQGGGDELRYAPKKPGCPTTTGSGLPLGCYPGGYGASMVIDNQVDGATQLVDVEVAATTGDVYVLASKPARLVRYLGTAVKAYLNGGPPPSPDPSFLITSFGGQQPAGLALFATGEIFVLTTQGTVFVFNGGGAPTTFATLNGQGVQIAIGIEDGGLADPVGKGRVLVTVKGANQVQSFGIFRNGSDKLVASTPGPEASVSANAPFGVADASLSGSVYTKQSATPVTVNLPTGHEVIFSKVVTGGITQGNHYIVSEAAVRATFASASCPLAGETLTLEGITRCVPQYVRGFSLGSPCQDTTGIGCYYLVYVAETGANVFGGTQQHHLEEDDFGFSTTCYDGYGKPFNTPGVPGFNLSLQDGQPRVYQATDDNDAPIVEGKLFTDITTGCNSHIGRGGEFSVFLTGRDERD